ncbi:MAG TPA: S41 family peptidase [bacterium]|nr:S41 family peptidase [bacterium]
MHRLRKAARPWVAGLLALSLLLVPFTQVQHAAAADASLVIAALHVLEQEYVDPVQPVPLLNAAIATLRKASSLSADALPEIPAGTQETEASAQFTGEFSRAAEAGGVSETQLAYTATAAMLASLHDSHTYFLDPVQLRESRRQLFGNPGFTGIGVTIIQRKDAAGVGWIFIEDVFPGSPAKAAGLQRFDKVLQVDGKPLQNVNVLDASQTIRGPAGSTASLVIQRGGQTLQLAVVRAPIRVPPIEGRFLVPGVAYLKIFEFSQGAGSQLRKVVEELQVQGHIRWAVLDLRGDPGGLIVEAANVGGVFLPPRTVLARITERGQQPSQLRTAGFPLLRRTPLVILVDGGSASASEILAGAFKDEHRATIVGEKTAGALGGSVTVALPEGGMSVTVERILSPNNSQVEGVGITPDVPVALTVADMERGQDTQLEAALHALGAAWIRHLLEAA